MKTCAKFWPISDLQLKASLSWRVGNRLLDHAGMASAVDARVVEHLLGALAALLLQQPAPLTFFDRADPKPGDAVRWTVPSLEAAFSTSYEGFDLTLGTHYGKKQLRVILLDGSQPVTICSLQSVGVDWSAVALATAALLETFEKLPVNTYTTTMPELEVEHGDTNVSVVVLEFQQRADSTRAAGAA